ncbi:carbonic anhydrase IV c [Aplochiton taeniatus]
MLSGGDLMGRYRAHQFHMHWGQDGAPGSEHTIDGKRYPMELHVVHVKEQYDSLSAAQLDVAGIAVLGFLFQTTAEDNPHVNMLIDALGRVPNHGNHTHIPDFRLSDLIPPAEELHSYYRYVGSMTTPGCEQVVTWTVFQKTLALSEGQLADMSTKCRFATGRAMVDIFRPIQPLDGRLVYRSKAQWVRSWPSSTAALGLFSLTWTLTH